MNQNFDDAYGHHWGNFALLSGLVPCGDFSQSIIERRPASLASLKRTSIDTLRLQIDTTMPCTALKMRCGIATQPLPNNTANAKNHPWLGVLLKTDNQFLLMLFILMFSLGTFVMLFVTNLQQNAVSKKEHQNSVEKKSEPVEISLGEFRTVKTEPENPGVLNVIQYEPVLLTQTQGNSLLPIRRLLKEKKNRLRSTLDFVINNASAEHLNEPDLKSIRAHMIKQLKEFLPEDQIADIIFSHFGSFKMQETI